tara:strand:+ start:538 stop:1629 length:1092 start_codon:yes stop_codon:yes gene_type:complete
MNNLNVNLDKHVYNKYKKNIKCFQDKTQYICGFSYEQIFEIIHLKIFNNSLLELINQKYNYIIVNIPIVTKKKIIKQINQLRKYKIGQLEYIKITPYFFFNSIQNVNNMMQLKFQTNIKKTFNYNKLKKEVDIYFLQEKKVCQIKCMFDKKTIKKLTTFLNNKKETGGIFYVKNVNHDFIGNVYSIHFHEKVSSELESVDIIDTSYNFHTHPKEAYINHNCELGWPSTDDLLTFLHSFIHYNTCFHVISTLEGLYILSIDKNCLSKIKKEKNMPIHLEQWIDKNLSVNKENVKLPKGKYIANFGYINSGEQYVKYMKTKKYPKWKCNIFSITFLSWDLLDKDVHTYFFVNVLKRNGKCKLKKI